MDYRQTEERLLALCVSLADGERHSSMTALVGFVGGRSMVALNIDEAVATARAIEAGRS